MPAMSFRIRWPDGQETDCYSPSLVIRDYVAVGGNYPVDVFMGHMRTALEIASERVRQKYGFACSRALDQLATLEQLAADHARLAADTDSSGPASHAAVTVLAFGDTD
ncbi:MSMEG_0570 family nitrogen starvation response protein [Bordetella sp. N]|uniref:MSMEG_0570 family nitrogen starvation response protein n=1 Tax=Bordetella sp. N TaxID=1746199 RepID=UPI00070EFACC|nr:MSMEG_0570 family nitrogen starvation response protein [Bordetella sp. N]ALM83304.1 hypothetical protein ASB57_10290 [Bordetella sp. N]